MNWALRYISSSSVKAFERDCNYDMKKQNHKYDIHNKGINSQSLIDVFDVYIIIYV